VTALSPCGTGRQVRIWGPGANFFGRPLLIANSEKFWANKNLEHKVGGLGRIPQPPDTRPGFGGKVPSCREVSRSGRAGAPELGYFTFFS